MAKVKAAGIFLVNKENKILVGHPTHHKPEFWSIPKGKIDGDETPLEAAIRETYEESNVKLFKDLHEFVELGKYVYRHKKKDIMLYAHFETEHANWDSINIMCNSNVPEERGGFPEMDDFKWVTVDEAREILHNTQVAALDKLDSVINNHTRMYCFGCEKVTPHVEKLSAVLDGKRVCDECRQMNAFNTLIKETDNSESHFIKTCKDIKWIEYGGLNDKNNVVPNTTHDDIAVGRGLFMGPFNDHFTWRTTPVTKIVKESEGYVKFKTENSTYELYYSKKLKLVKE